MLTKRGKLKGLALVLLLFITVFAASFFVTLFVRYSRSIPVVPVSTQAVTVTIDWPVEGEVVTRHIDVRGTLTGKIPDGYMLWLYLYAVDIRLYYVYFFPAFEGYGKNEPWLVQNVVVGSELLTDKGTRYDIGIIRVDMADGEKLKRQQADFKTLPPSAEKLAEITVYREK